MRLAGRDECHQGGNDVIEKSVFGDLQQDAVRFHNDRRIAARERNERFLAESETGRQHGRDAWYFGRRGPPQDGSHAVKDEVVIVALFALADDHVALADADGLGELHHLAEVVLRNVPEQRRTPHHFVHFLRIRHAVLPEAAEKSANGSQHSHGFTQIPSAKRRKRKSK